MLPAYDERLLIVKRDAVDGHDRLAIELIDARGQVLRSVSSAWTNLAGQLSSGELVCVDGVLGWDGSRRVSPWAGAAAVLGGTHVLADNTAAGGSRHVVRLYSVLDGSHVEYELPARPFMLSPSYNQDATCVAYSQRRGDPWILVAGASIGVQAIDIGWAATVTWTDADRLLAVGERGAVQIDVMSGEREPVPGLPKQCSPRICVSGRVDVDELVAIQRPPHVGPIDTTERETLLAAERVRLSGALSDMPSLASPINMFAVARVRSCLAPARVPVGASRFGGRPDLPAKHPWPRYQGAPMAFLGQLRCDELHAAFPDSGVAPDGLLVIFTAVSEDGDFYGDNVHVEIVTSGNFTRRAWPTRLTQAGRLESALASVEPAVLPAISAPLEEDRARNLDEAIAASGIVHYLFGPGGSQGYTREHDGYRALLRLEGDSIIGTKYGDGGRLTILIPTHQILGPGPIDAEIDIESA